MSAFEVGDHEFDLGAALARVDKATLRDILTVASALRYSNWFQEFTCVNYDVKGCVWKRPARLAFVIIVFLICFWNRGFDFAHRPCFFRDPGLENIRSVVAHTSEVRKLILVNIKAGKVGFAKLAESLADGHHGLSYLNVSRNNIGDR